VTETPQEPESDSVLDVIYAVRILFTKCKKYSRSRLIRTRRTLSILKSIFGSDTVAQAFIYLCEHGAATAWVLQVQLDMPEATAYRALKRLRSLGIVKPQIKVPRRKRQDTAGPTPKVWGLPGCSEEEVARAILLHYRCMSPKYRVAEEVAQRILDGYLVPRRLEEISYREILVQIRELRIPFMAPDIADLAAQYLHEKGVKVWR